jgi:hypothetical protein
MKGFVMKWIKVALQFFVGAAAVAVFCTNGIKMNGWSRSW